MTTTTPTYIRSCKRLSTALISSVGRPACIVVTFQPVTQNATGLATAMRIPAIMHPTRTFCARACSSGPSDLTRGRIRWVRSGVVSSVSSVSSVVSVFWVGGLESRRVSVGVILVFSCVLGWVFCCWHVFAWK